MQEMKAQSLGREDPLEEEMGAHSSIPAWEIPWAEQPGGLQSMGSQWVGHNSATKQQQEEEAPRQPSVDRGWYVGSENLLRWSVLSACLWIQVHGTGQLILLATGEQVEGNIRWKRKCQLSVVSDSVTIWTVACRLLCPWNSPGKNTGVGSYSLLQGIFLTEGSNSGLLRCRQILYHRSHNTWLTGVFFPDRRWETSKSTTRSRQMRTVGGRYSTSWGGSTYSTLRMKRM